MSADLLALRDEHGGDALAFFLLLIPFTDRYGCVPDEPVTLKGLICPMWEDVTRVQVAGWVEWMVDRRLLKRVTGPDGDRGLQLTGFQRHQGEARLERERPSQFEPEGWLETPSDRARRQSRESMQRTREARRENTSVAGDSWTTDGQLPELDGSWSGEVKRREDKRREERTPLSPLSGSGVGRDNGRRRVTPEDGAWAVVARAAAMDREETNDDDTE